jgi:DNA-binding CsgD family transcriptional regulator
MAWAGSVEPAAKLLAGEAEQAAAADPALAAVMLADASAACTATNSYHKAQALAERAAALLSDGDDPLARAHVLINLGWALLLRGEARRARSVLDEGQRLAAGLGLDPLAPGHQWLNFMLRSRIPSGEFEQALTEGLALAERAREAGALAELAGALVVAADAALRVGDWAAADAWTLEAIQVAQDAGQDMWHGYAMSIRARLTAARGQEDEAARLGRDALALAESADLRSGLRYSYAALGFLNLGLGRVGEAISQLETVERLLAGSGLEEPLLVPWAPDLVEAYARNGRTGDAGRVLAMLDRQAAAAGTVPANAMLMRCRGILEEDFGPPLARALALDDQRPMPFERARTLLALGRRLHRARRRAEARDRLREALAGFERVGAAAWAAQAQAELRAAGARRRQARDDSLTEQELRVCAAVARGASNREIAAELFVTNKTVEFHLRQIYRKLGVSSRAQLVATLANGRLLSTGDPSPPTGGPPLTHGEPPRLPGKGNSRTLRTPQLTVMRYLWRNLYTEPR